MRDMTRIPYDVDALQRAQMARGVTFGEIARDASLDAETVSRAMRTGRGRIRTFRAIARVLGVPLASLVPPPALIPAGGPPAQSSAIERNGSAATRRVPRAAKRDRSGKPTTEAQRALRAHESGESGLKAESDSVAIGSGSVSSVVGSNGACPEPGRGEAARV